MQKTRKRKVPQTRAKIGERRREQMRIRLIAAGAQTIAERGHEKATIDDFISEAGVSRTTFYNHFATREELFEAMWATMGHDPYAEMMQVCKSITSPAEHFSALTRLCLRKAESKPTWGWLVIAMSAERATVNRDLRSYPLPDLKAGETAGVFHFDVLICAADLVVTSVRGAMLALLKEKREPGYAEAISKMLLLALGVPRTEAHRISHLPLG